TSAGVSDSASANTSVTGSTGTGGAGANATMTAVSTSTGATSAGGASSMDGSTTAGGSGGTGGSAGEACPPSASFCSGFESPDLPDGAVYNRNGAPLEWTIDFEVDSTVKYAGNSSLRVRSESENTGSAYKMLAVPAPGAAFWARFYLRSDADLG